LTSKKPTAGGGWFICQIYGQVVTLTAVLALHQFGQSNRAQQAKEAGLTYLRQLADHDYFMHTPSNGAELIIPRLLAEAEQAGLAISRAPYQKMIEKGERRQMLVQMIPQIEKTQAIFSWEAFGTEPRPEYVDGSGGVGHSPAAAARWLALAQSNPALADQRAQVQAYLRGASAVTQTGIPDVVAAAYPTHRFEQSFVLWAMMIANLLTDGRFTPHVSPIIDALAQAIGPHGLGASDHIMPDGDDTAAALAVLKTGGRAVDTAVLRQFEADSYFFAWHRELQSSVSITARAVHTLGLFGQTAPGPFQAMLAQQGADGRWPGDKWQCSWLYTTLHCFLAAMQQGAVDAAQNALAAFLRHQHEDGSWGEAAPTPVETAYALLALQTASRTSRASTAISQSRQRGFAYLQEQYQPGRPFHDKLWLTKDEYNPRQIDRAFVLCSLLAEMRHTNTW
jgi:halimadienyl-diphosphate synthase